MARGRLLRPRRAPARRGRSPRHGGRRHGAAAAGAPGSGAQPLCQAGPRRLCLLPPGAGRSGRVTLPAKTFLSTPNKIALALIAAAVLAALAVTAFVNRNNAASQAAAASAEVVREDSHRLSSAKD